MWHHLLEDSALKNGSRVLPLCCALSSMLLLCLQAPPAGAQSEFTLSQRIREIIDRPEFAHANFAIEFYSLAAAPEAAQQVADQTLGEIAAAAYDANLVTGAIAGDYDLIIRNGHIIDMLGQSEVSLLLDNRSLSKLSQGITTEITGEGGSIAPQNEKTIAPQKPFLDHFHLTVDWTTLDGYFQRLEKQGTPLNIGTYVGSAQIREAVIGDDDRAPTPAELGQMKVLVEQAMKDGALGLSSALIYPPNIYAKTDELIALAQVASKYGGLYATHMRSEGASEMPALAEAIRIGREANLPVEIFHLKVSGKPRWGSMKNVVAAIQLARDFGLDIAADMYPYTAGATALASALPPWAADGGPQKLLARLKDPEVRARIKKDLAGDHSDWENLLYDCGGAAGVLISSVENSQLTQFDGKTLEDVAKAWKKSP